MNGACSQLLEVRADILIRSVLHPEPAGDRAELREAEALVKVAGVGVAFDDGVKLKDAEAELFCLGEAVEDELFADVAAAGGGCDGVAGVADVAAAADVVGVEDVGKAMPSSTTSFQIFMISGRSVGVYSRIIMRTSVCLC